MQKNYIVGGIMQKNKIMGNIIVKKLDYGENYAEKLDCGEGGMQKNKIVGEITQKKKNMGEIMLKTPSFIIDVLCYIKFLEHLSTGGNQIGTGYKRVCMCRLYKCNNHTMETSTVTYNCKNN